MLIKLLMKLWKFLVYATVRTALIKITLYFDVSYTSVSLLIIFPFVFIIRCVCVSIKFILYFERATCWSNKPSEIQFLFNFKCYSVFRFSVFPLYFFKCSILFSVSSTSSRRRENSFRRMKQ